MNVAQAIAAVMGKLGPIGKTEAAKGVPYKFRGIEAMTAALQPILAEVGLVIIPSAQSIVIDPSPGQKEAWQDVMVKFDWIIMGPDGDSITASTYGIGRDHTDKGANKAQTQAFKYLLMHLFCVSDPKDDGDSHDYTDAFEDAASARPEGLDELWAAVLEAAKGPHAQALKDWAHGMERKLTEKALAEDEGWRMSVRAKLATLAQAEPEPDEDGEVAPAADEEYGDGY